MAHDNETLRVTLDWKVFPAPAGLHAWLVWEDESVPVLAFAVSTESGSLDLEPRDGYLTGANGVRRQYTHWVNDYADDAANRIHDYVDLANTRLFVLVADDCGEDYGDKNEPPWVEYGKYAFFSKKRAQEMRAKQKAEEEEREAARAGS